MQNDERSIMGSYFEVKATTFSHSSGVTHLPYPHLVILQRRPILQLRLPNHISGLTIGVLAPNRELPENLQIYGGRVRQVAETRLLREDGHHGAIHLRD